MPHRKFSKSQKVEFVVKVFYGRKGKLFKLPKQLLGPTVINLLNFSLTHFLNDKFIKVPLQKVINRYFKIPKTSQLSVTLHNLGGVSTKPFWVLDFRSLGSRVGIWLGNCADSTTTFWCQQEGECHKRGCYGTGRRPGPTRKKKLNIRGTRSFSIFSLRDFTIPLDRKWLGCFFVVVADSFLHECQSTASMFVLEYFPSSCPKLFCHLLTSQSEKERG